MGTSRFLNIEHVKCQFQKNTETFRIFCIQSWSGMCQIFLKWDMLWDVLGDILLDSKNLFFHQRHFSHLKFIPTKKRHILTRTFIFSPNIFSIVNKVFIKIRYISQNRYSSQMNYLKTKWTKKTNILTFFNSTTNYRMKIKLNELIN